MADQPTASAPPHIVIAGRSRAGKILCSPRKRDGLAFLVSIGGAQDPPPAGLRNIANRIRLVFEDTLSLDECGPSRDDVERLIQFARRVDFTHGGLLTHCESGISRSSAAAIIVLAVALGPGREGEAVARVREVHPAARPNRLMLQLADEILVTGGVIERLAYPDAAAATEED